MFEKELPMIRMIVIATITTNKLFLLRFDKIFYTMTTDAIMVIHGRLNIIVSSNTTIYNYFDIHSNFTHKFCTKRLKIAFQKDVESECYFFIVV